MIRIAEIGLSLHNMKNNSKINIRYGYDFGDMNIPAEGCYIHLLCLDGEGSFVLDGKCFHVGRNDLVVTLHMDRIKNIASSPDMKVEYIVASTKYLNNMLPANNYGIGGSIALFDNPVIPLTESEADIFLTDIRRIRERMREEGHAFQSEVIGSLFLTMVYDIFGFHARHYSHSPSSNSTSFVMKSFIRLLESGMSRKRRDLTFYAGQLNVSVEYLCNTVKRVSGQSATSFIDRYTLPMVQEYLKEGKLSFSQIAEQMNFSSLSYFSRYVTKHLGMSPGEYRRAFLPKKENFIDKTPAKK